MAKKLYVCVNEYAGDKVGTLEEIDNWLATEGSTAADSEFYELGKEVRVTLAVVNKEGVQWKQ